MHIEKIYPPLTLAAMQRYLKKRWWDDQNCPHMDFFIPFSALISSEASWNLRSASTHWGEAEEQG